MDARPPNLWFIAAYVLLTVIVVIGFFFQAQTVHDLEKTQQQLLETIEVQEKVMPRSGLRQVLLQQNLCDLFLTIAEEIEQPTGIDLTQEILVSFEREGIKCRVPVNP